MKSSFSIYLDLVRFLAAVLVVISHMAKENVFPHEIIKYIPDFGREAVIIFFVLSGFVIAYTKNKKHTSIQDYSIARFTRIYSVAIPVIFITVALDMIGIALNPELYTGLYQYDKLYIYIPFHLLFLGEIWTISEQPFTVQPYWSLGYEVWYYVFFVFFSFFVGVKRIILCSLLLLFLGYKLLLLLPIWLSGVYLFRFINVYKLNQLTALFLFFGTIILVILFEALNIDKFLLNLSIESWPFPQLPLGSARHYFADYAMCILVLTNFYAAWHLKMDKIKEFKKFIVAPAQYTFTLYLLHAPVMIFLLRNLELDKFSVTTTILISSGIAISSILLGELTEKRKHHLKPIVSFVVQLFSKAFGKLNFWKKSSSEQ